MTTHGVCRFLNRLNLHFFFSLSNSGLSSLTSNPAHSAAKHLIHNPKPYGKHLIPNWMSILCPRCFFSLTMPWTSSTGILRPSAAFQPNPQEPWNQGLSGLFSFYSWHQYYRLWRVLRWVDSCQKLGHEYFHVKFSLWEDIQYWLSYGNISISFTCFADVNQKPININRLLLYSFCL